MNSKISKLKIIEQIIEEWIYCYPNRTLSEQKIKILEEQHQQNLLDDSKGVVSRLHSVPRWITREIELEKDANWFLVLATCLDFIYSQKEGRVVRRYTDEFRKSSISFLSRPRDTSNH
tara:strand:- start:1072 stop:1425 length:354 start_codon:yes stop_codon:yes gene_type:complete